MSKQAKYQSTKRYGHEVGLSCAFRQWRADSHCNQLHGYALAFKFVFECDVLDDKNWAVDFGGLKAIKRALEYHFDHTTVIATDDPLLEKFRALHDAGGLTLRELEAVGCEKFAQFAYNMADSWLRQEFPLNERRRRGLRVVSCEVSEHGANSAIYYGE